MNYDFPPSAAPDRQTYTLMLRACIYRGDLTLALSIFRDMLDPNGMSLRLPGSAPGRAGRPPNTLRAFRPAVEDYTQFFTGFVRFGEVGTISAEARDYWTAHPEAYQRAGGGDVGELFEDLDTRERACPSLLRLRSCLSLTTTIAALFLRRSPFRRPAQDVGGRHGRRDRGDGGPLRPGLRRRHADVQAVRPPSCPSSLRSTPASRFPTR